MTTKTISRTKATELINGTKGKFFTVTFTKANGQMRSINGNTKGKTTNLGYLNIYSLKDKGYRNVNPRTITSVSLSGIIYKVK
jgi:hypothetical protein